MESELKWRVHLKDGTVQEFDPEWDRAEISQSLFGLLHEDGIASEAFPIQDIEWVELTRQADTTLERVKQLRHRLLAAKRLLFSSSTAAGSCVSISAVPIQDVEAIFDELQSKETG